MTGQAPGLRVGVVADIGQATYHVGDEAIGHAVHDALLSRGVTPVMFTRDLEHTRRFFGDDVQAALTLHFPWPPVDRERYREEIELVLAGRPDVLPPDDQVFRVIEELRGLDAVLIAGGGNLNSRYGWLLHERAAFVRLADHLGLPAVVTGQTLGPVLTAHDELVVADLIRQCRLVGLRESTSVDTAHRIAPDAADHVVAGLDDAQFWPPQRDHEAAPGDPRRGPLVVVSLSGSFGQSSEPEALDAIAAGLTAFVQRHDGRVALLPHMARPGAGDQDEAINAALARLLPPGRVENLPITDAAECVARTRSADLVVASRYHAAVFALGVSPPVPVLALVPDAYGWVRIGGALANWGLSALARSLDDLVRGQGVHEALEALWAVRREVGAAEAAEAARLAPWHEHWWDAVVDALAARPSRPGAMPAVPAEVVGGIGDSWQAMTVDGFAADAEREVVEHEEQRRASFDAAQPHLLPRSHPRHPDRSGHTDHPARPGRRTRLHRWRGWVRRLLGRR